MNFIWPVGRLAENPWAVNPFGFRELIHPPRMLISKLLTAYTHRMALAPEEVACSTWDILENTIEQLAGSQPYNWLFRGQSNASWPLAPRIEREYDFAFLKETEFRMLRDVRSTAHLYTAHVPEAEDTTAWLSMMQHHGAPTRLLDWTYSPFVALYFAVEADEDEAEDAALWAIHNDTLEGVSRNRAERLFGISHGDVLESQEHFNKLAFGPYFLPGDNEGLVVRVLPQLQISRLSSQQGCFLFNCNSNIRFEESLQQMMAGVTRRWLVRIRFSRRERVEYLKRLMLFNIHPGTLFPDLDGLARFIRLKNKLLQFPDRVR